MDDENDSSAVLFQVGAVIDKAAQEARVQLS